MFLRNMYLKLYVLTLLYSCAHQNYIEIDILNTPAFRLNHNTLHNLVKTTYFEKDQNLIFSKKYNLTESSIDLKLPTITNDNLNAIKTFITNNDTFAIYLKKRSAENDSISSSCNSSSTTDRVLDSINLPVGFQEKKSLYVNSHILIKIDKKTEKMLVTPLFTVVGYSIDHNLKQFYRKQMGYVDLPKPVKSEEALDYSDSKPSTSMNMKGCSEYPGKQLRQDLILEEHEDLEEDDFELTEPAEQERKISRSKLLKKIASAEQTNKADGGGKKDLSDSFEQITVNSIKYNATRKSLKNLEEKSNSKICNKNLKDIPLNQLKKFNSLELFSHDDYNNLNQMFKEAEEYFKSIKKPELATSRYSLFETPNVKYPPQYKYEFKIGSITKILVPFEDILKELDISLVKFLVVRVFKDWVDFLKVMTFKDDTEFVQCILEIFLIQSLILEEVFELEEINLIVLRFQESRKYLNDWAIEDFVTECATTLGYIDPSLLEVIIDHRLILNYLSDDCFAYLKKLRYYANYKPVSSASDLYTYPSSKSLAPMYRSDLSLMDCLLMIERVVKEKKEPPITRYMLELDLNEPQSNKLDASINPVKKDLIPSSSSENSVYDSINIDLEQDYRVIKRIENLDFINDNYLQYYKKSIILIMVLVAVNCIPAFLSSIGKVWILPSQRDANFRVIYKRPPLRNLMYFLVGIGVQTQISLMIYFLTKFPLYYIFNVTALLHGIVAQQIVVFFQSVNTNYHSIYTAVSILLFTPLAFWYYPFSVKYCAIIIFNTILGQIMFTIGWRFSAHLTFTNHSFFTDKLFLDETSNHSFSKSRFKSTAWLIIQTTINSCASLSILLERPRYIEGCSSMICDHFLYLIFYICISSLITTFTIIFNLSLFNYISWWQLYFQTSNFTPYFLLTIFEIYQYAQYTIPSLYVKNFIVSFMISTIGGASSIITGVIFTRYIL